MCLSCSFLFIMSLQSLPLSPPQTLWNMFRYVSLNQQKATMVFVLHSHIEFYFTKNTQKLTHDLADLMDIDESRKSEHFCRVAIKPSATPSQQQFKSNNSTTQLTVNSKFNNNDNDNNISFIFPQPIILSLQFESAISYERFITLLIRSQVFYCSRTRKITKNSLQWFIPRNLASTIIDTVSFSLNKNKNKYSSLPSSHKQHKNNKRHYHHQTSLSNHDHNQLKLVPWRNKNLNNYFPLLSGWKQQQTTNY